MVTEDLQKNLDSVTPLIKSEVQVLSKNMIQGKPASESLGKLVLRAHSQRFSFNKCVVGPGTLHFKNHPSLCTFKFENSSQIMLPQAIAEKEEVG